MKKEISCGAIVIKNGKVLLIKHKEGHWGFPKGHMESGESYIETAKREVKEETNIDIKILSDEYFIESYIVKENINKDVIYYLAEPLNDEILLQESEVNEGEFIKINEICNHLNFDETKKLFLNAIDKYNNIN